MITGESAGGTLAALVAYAAAAGQAPGCVGHVPIPIGVVLAYPAIDPSRLPTRDGRSALDAFIGGTAQDHPDRVRAVSPETYLSARTPPTLLIQPAADFVVDPASVAAFTARAQRAGHAITLIEYPYGTHSFDLVSGSIGQQTRRSLTRNFLEYQMR